MVPYETRTDGYCRWRTWDRVRGSEVYVYVHQLVAIANGADPRKVFSDGRYQVHHESGVKYDNRPSNLSVEKDEDHCRMTFHEEAPTP